MSLGAWLLDWIQPDCGKDDMMAGYGDLLAKLFHSEGLVGHAVWKQEVKHGDMVV